MYMLAECARACGCREPPEEAKPAPDCVDRDKTGACAHWASLGECENNPSFTKLKYPSSCGTCDWLDYKKRCQMPPDRLPAVREGQMSESFNPPLCSLLPTHRP